jgi:hypothetical protein
MCKMQVIFCYYIYFNRYGVYSVSKTSLSVRHNLDQSPPWKSQNINESYVNCFQNIFEAASLLDSDIDPYVIITELLDYILNIR